MSIEQDPTRDGWRRLNGRGGYFDKIGPVWYRRDAERAIHLAFRADPTHDNGNGIVHGGMLLSLTDQALGMLVFEATDRKPCATISLACDFLSAVKAGDWVEASASIVRKGAGIVMVEGELRVGDRLILTASGVWKVLGVD